MDKDGHLYLDPEASEEDRQRAKDWGDEIEADEIRKQQEQIEKIRELEKQQ